MIAEILLFFIVLYFLFYFFHKKDNTPPGPKGLPFIGSFPPSNIQQCLELKNKYGKLVMMRFGIYNFLYIFDYKIAKEAYLKLDFSNRPDWAWLQHFKGEQDQGKANGIIFSNNAHWNHNRRFLLRHLRDLGMGKSRMEGLIMREVEDLVEDFRTLTDKPSALPSSLNVVALNIIWQLVASFRYELSDKKVEKFIEKIEEALKYFVIMAIPDIFPFLKYLVPESILSHLTGKSIQDEAIQMFVGIVEKFIEDHLAKLDPNNPIDLMDDYLIEMKEKKSEDYSHFNLIDLTRIAYDLFAAGSDTTSNMVRWNLLYMAKFPLIQSKIQAEIDEVVQRDVFPGLEQRDRLAYLDATINEVQRHCSMVHLGVARSTSSDMILEGYHIPQNTVVFSVTGVSHHDSSYWKNPDKFNPSRFLDSNGKFIANCDGFQAFGLGKRQCLGEQFARMELYLIMAALLQRFTFGPSEGREIDLSPIGDTVTLFPKSQNLLIKLRN